MAYVFGFIALANFVVLLAISTGMAMQGDFRGLLTMLQALGIIVGVVLLPWAFVLPIRGVRFAWRKLTGH